MRVLVVEDSPAVRERLRSMMAGIPGVDLAGEVGGETDALRSIGIIQPDVVILDLTLAEGGGLGALRRIREMQWHVRVIVLTNYAYPQYRKKCLELGADHFLDKTREIDELAGLLAGMADAY